MDRLFENDTLLKILSVLVAIALWVQVTLTNQKDANRNFGPVALEWTPPGAKNLDVASLQPNAVEIQIKGPPQVVAGASLRSFAAWVDLSHITKPGTYSLPVVASVPSDTSLVSVSPSQIRVVLDQIGSRTLPVQVEAVGTVPNAYQLDAIVPSVRSAVVSGPTNDLDRVRRLVAELPVQGRTQSFAEEVILVPLDAHGEAVSHLAIDPPMITANVKIAPKPPQATVGVVVQLTGHPANGYHVTGITVTPGKITITGTVASLKGVTSVNTAPIDIGGATADVTRTVPVQLPAGVTAVGADTVTATVGIARGP
ncbi:MAG: hypothetical protein K6U14_07640 [Firmicutes bacterium]|nr:hypothetical protein [Alicyclobacillaceae bacterium]MCL6497487.1 hypothetical protein [Bacillota bacterium]